MQHEHLTTRVGPRPNANGGHRQGLGKPLTQRRGNEFNEHHVCTRSLQLLRLGNERITRRPTALHLVAPYGVHTLRREPEVSADRHASSLQKGHCVGKPATALELDHLRAHGHERGSILIGLLGRDLVAPKWHVGHHQSHRLGTGHAGRVIRHIFQGDRQGGVVALQDHTQGIANEQNLHPGCIEHMGKGCVIAGEHGEPLTLGRSHLQAR